MNTELQDLSHFPEDRDAPKDIQKQSFLKRIYERHKKSVDIIVFTLISITTLIAASLSIYIIIAKYF